MEGIHDKVLADTKDRGSVEAVVQGIGVYRYLPGTVEATCTQS